MVKVIIRNYGCDDTTTVEMEITEEQFAFMEIFIANNNLSAQKRRPCMPTMEMETLI